MCVLMAIYVAEAACLRDGSDLSLSFSSVNTSSDAGVASLTGPAAGVPAVSVTCASAGASPSAGGSGLTTSGISVASRGVIAAHYSHPLEQLPLYSLNWLIKLWG